MWNTGCKTNYFTCYRRRLAKNEPPSFPLWKRTKTVETNFFYKHGWNMRGSTSVLSASKFSQTKHLFSISESGVSLHDNRIRHLHSWFLTAAESLPEWGVTFKIAALAACEAQTRPPARRMENGMTTVCLCTSQATMLLPPGLVYTTCCCREIYWQTQLRDSHTLNTTYVVLNITKHLYKRW